MKAQRICYVDTADTGADYLCAVAADVVEGEAYVLDVLVPKDKPAQLSCQMASVRTAMLYAGLSLAYASQASVLEDYDALSISADFRALCAR